MKYDLSFDPPLMNAAGWLGLAPDPRAAIDLSQLGAFVTNPVSLAPRHPAQGRRYLPYPGGFLLHTGHPNPGLSAVVRRFSPRWARLPLPVIVHLLCQNVADVGEMVRRLEIQPGVVGFELGLPPDIETAAAHLLVQAALGELPLVVRLPLERVKELASAISAAFPSVAFSLGPPRGVLPLPGSTFLRGRLYGPSVYPLALAAVREAARLGLPVIASGGVYHPDQVQTMLSAGAIAVQLDAVLWRVGWLV